MDLKQIALLLRPEKVSPHNLYLDPYNPRFFGRTPTFPEGANPLDPKIQEIVRSAIVKDFDADELYESILEVGFLPMDRMVGYKYDDENYIIIEGNRRLAAIKTIFMAEEKKEIIIPQNVMETINEIEILCLEPGENDKREVTWFLQGIRHISGIKDWGPYQQAQLVNSLMEKHDMKFTEAGKAIGVGPKKAGQMLRAYKGLKQMESDPDYAKNATPDLFSHFEQAYVKAPIREWLEWDEKEVNIKTRPT